MEVMKNSHMLFIGGTGFIGHHLLNSLQQNSLKVTSVSLNPPKEKRFVTGVRYLHFDMLDQALVKKHIVDDFDFVVNLGSHLGSQNGTESSMWLTLGVQWCKTGSNMEVCFLFPRSITTHHDHLTKGGLAP